MIKGRNGWSVELSTIENIVDGTDFWSITMANGWSMFVDKDECDGFVPQVGDWILTEQAVNPVVTVIIEGRVIRHKTPKQVEADHQTFLNKNRLRKLEAFVSEGDKLRERIKALPLPLRKRMARFEAESGDEFLIDSAPYEMYALEGAAALLRKVMDLGYITDVDNPADDGGADLDGAVQWINDWWDINSKNHEPPYDYEKQMELVPDFGDGHSGNTAAAAKWLAVAVLEGKEV